MPGPRRTLDGKIVLVTRPREQAAELVSLLRDRGAMPLVAPAIAVSPAPPSELDPALDALASGAFEWVVFTSRSGVEAVVERLAARGRAFAPSTARVAAVGKGTAEALRESGVDPDLVPATYTTVALARAFPRSSGRGSRDRVLLARADIATPDLEAALERKGWAAVRVNAYRTRPAARLPAAAARALREKRVDAVTFTSASTVDGFIRLLEREGLGLPTGGSKVVAIGPVTARAATERGLAVDAVARPHTIEGLVRALERVLGLVRERGRT